MEAKEIIIQVIRNKVATMNLYRNDASCIPETLERFRHELNGMLVCLKNISSSNEFYVINFYDDGYEFGYYDEDGIWFSIEGRNHH